jgi:hypothetical protein
MTSKSTAGKIDVNEYLSAPRARPRPVRHVEITYWSQAENRYKTRLTTCVFIPD